MTAGDAQLGELVTRLAQMPPPDRAYVVEQLAEDDLRLLEPYLKRVEVRSMSPTLHALVQACGDDGTPPMLTPRAASALRIAAAVEPLVASEGRPAIGGARGALRGRLGAWLERR